MTGLLQDVRYALRQLRKTPGFTAVAVITLALGIGANTAMFSIVEGVLLRPLPFRDADRIVSVDGIRDWSQSKTLMDASSYETGQTNLVSSFGAERVAAAEVTWDFFRTLGVEPVLGRTFLPEEEKAQLPSEAILSHELWTTRFAADPNLVGKSVQINGRPLTVVGVMPAGFDFPNRAKLWAPSPADIKGEMFGLNFRWAEHLARLRTGFTLKQARAELKVISQTQPSDDGHPASVVPLQESMVQDFSRALVVLMVAVGLVLLIACANVANLLLARGTSRLREFTIRMATGAGRPRLIRQLLSESLLLASLGGVTGVLLATKGVEVAKKLYPALEPFASRISIDTGVLLFSLAVAVASGVLAGLLPALQSSRLDLNSALKEVGTGYAPATSARRHRLMNVCCVAEIAVTLVLLTGAGLLIRSFGRLTDVKPGFRIQDVTAAKVSLVEPIYENPAERVSFLENALNRSRAVPAIQDAALISLLPFSHEGAAMYILQSENGAPTQLDEDVRCPGWACPVDVWASPGYFRTMGIPLIAGRDFSDQDRHLPAPAQQKQSPSQTGKNSKNITPRSTVGIISESVARGRWPGQNPIGKRLRLGGQIIEVIGVAGDVRNWNLAYEPEPTLYLPIFNGSAETAFLVVHSSLSPQATGEVLQRAVATVDKNEPISSVMSMSELLSQSVAEPRFRAWLLGVFAGLALLLAIDGIYGVMSFSVTQRTHEIGVRMAMGAHRLGIVQMVLRRAMLLALAGLLIGCAASFALTRLLSDFLFGIPAADPLTFAAVAALLIVTAIMASYIPARRAAKVDPMVALRYE